MKRAAALLACLAALAAAADEKMLVKEAVVKAPVDQVFKAWTTSDGVASFFAPEARIEARPDGPFEVYMNPYAKPGLKGADDMRVLAVQEDKLLSFTWNAPPSLPEARKQRTVVILRFAPVDGGTKVTLTQVGWGEGGEWDENYKYFDKAWGNVLANLQRRFVEGPIDFTEWRRRMRAFQDQQDARK